MIGVEFSHREAQGTSLMFFFVQTLSVLAWASQRELAHLKATFFSEVRFAVRSSSSFSDLFFCVTSHKSNGRSGNRKPAISDDKSYLVTPESTLKLREVSWT